MSESESHVKQLLETAVIEHTRRKDKVRRATWSIRITIMLLGMIATVLLGLSFSDSAAYLSYSRNAALICTALGTFLAGLAAFWNLDTYWIKRKVILTHLQALQQEFEFRQSQMQPMPAVEVERFFQRYNEIIQQQTEYWEGMLARTDQSTGGKQPAGDV